VEFGSEYNVAFGVEGGQVVNRVVLVVFYLGFGFGGCGRSNEDVAFEGIEIIMTAEYLDLGSFR